ncbi:hypothetical protein NDU88_000938 [Pleurodeles waltl]|uniref:Uncharacterized protein n=1 Tax=Pleurodeles waltl TaxID=8319 RepID=A0AAV7V830_PLEWA|nr:hypothetical protein NDU88_000938 [Pleurodeles waltl]
MGQKGGAGPQPQGHLSVDTTDCPGKESTADTAALVRTYTKLDKILEAIADTGIDLHASIDAIATKLGLLRDDQHELADRVMHTENEITELRPMITDLVGQVRSLTTKVQELEARAENSEGRSRLNHLSIVGFPEGTECADPVNFFDAWLRQVHLKMNKTKQRAY